MKEGILVSALLFGVLTLVLFTDMTRSKPLEKGQPRNVSYNIEDSAEPTKSTHPDCPRSNGFYAFPATDSCQRYLHCLEGQAYEKTCPAGVIFDPTKGTCTHPDLTRREDCTAKQVHNFTCPNSESRISRTRFGDHDRFHHPSDCRMFFICLKDGRPRLGGCPLGKVFNENTGFCDAPSNVPQCNDYYGKKNITQLLEQSESLDFVFGDPNANANEIDNFSNLPSSSHKTLSKLWVIFFVCLLALAMGHDVPTLASPKKEVGGLEHLWIFVKDWLASFFAYSLGIFTPVLKKWIKAKFFAQTIFAQGGPPVQVASPVNAAPLLPVIV